MTRESAGLCTIWWSGLILARVHRCRTFDGEPPWHQTWKAMKIYRKLNYFIIITIQVKNIKNYALSSASDLSSIALAISSTTNPIIMLLSGSMPSILRFCHICMKNNNLNIALYIKKNLIWVIRELLHKVAHGVISSSVATRDIIWRRCHRIRVHKKDPLGLVPKLTRIVSKRHKDFVIHSRLTQIQRTHFPIRKRRLELNVSAQQNSILNNTE